MDQRWISPSQSRDCFPARPSRDRASLRPFPCNTREKRSVGDSRSPSTASRCPLCCGTYPSHHPHVKTSRRGEDESPIPSNDAAPPYRRTLAACSCLRWQLHSTPTGKGVEGDAVAQGDRERDHHCDLRPRDGALLWFVFVGHDSEGARVFPLHLT